MTTRPNLSNTFFHCSHEEKERLVSFAERMGRPLSWVIRDAIQRYIDAIESDPAALARLASPKMDLRQTPVGTPRRGRPPKP